MGRKENIKQAKDIIAKRRSDSINAYENHTAEISAIIAEFDSINKEIACTGTKIMASVLVKNNTNESLETIRAKYDILVEKKKQLLSSHGYPNDYCDIKYYCDKCSDTGYDGINMCECLKKELISAAYESSGLYSLIKSQTFDTFSLDFYEKNDKIIMNQNLKILKSFAENFSSQQPDNFLFLGATGLGKTHLSSAVARTVIEKGAYVVYEPAITMFSEFENRRFGALRAEENYEDTEKYTDCDLLIIDDLGCEMTNQFTLSCLYNIINNRMIQHKSTIISTNISQNELRKRYSDRIVSRIFGEYKPLVFRGSDIREQKIRKNLKNFNYTE